MSVAFVRSLDCSKKNTTTCLPQTSPKRDFEHKWHAVVDEAVATRGGVEAEATRVEVAGHTGIILHPQVYLLSLTRNVKCAPRQILNINVRSVSRNTVRSCASKITKNSYVKSAKVNCSSRAQHQAMLTQRIVTTACIVHHGMILEGAADTILIESMMTCWQRCQTLQF